MESGPDQFWKTERIEMPCGVNIVDASVCHISVLSTTSL